MIRSFSIVRKKTERTNIWILAGQIPSPSQIFKQRRVLESGKLSNTLHCVSRKAS